MTFIILGIVVGVVAMGIGGRLFFKGAMSDDPNYSDGASRYGCSVFVIGLVVLIVFVNLALQGGG